MKNLILIILSFIFINNEIFAQSTNSYYWSKNKKIQLTEIKGKTYIKFNGEVERSKLSDLGVENKDLSTFSNSNSFGAINSIEKDVNYTFAITSGSIEKQNFKSQNIYFAPYYKSENGNELGLSHLFMVKIKSESDFHILDSMAREFRVKVVGNHKYRPLWYTLSCSADSKENALQLANLFYESGFFQYSQPDFIEDLKFESTQAPPPPNDPEFGQQWNLKNTGQMGGTPNADINMYPSDQPHLEW